MKTVVVIGSGNVAEALAGAIAASPFTPATATGANGSPARTAVRSPAIRKSWLRPTSI